MIPTSVLRDVEYLTRMHERVWQELAAQARTEGPCALRTDAGEDLQSDNMGNLSAGVTGTSTGTAATTMTDTGASWTTNEWVGRVVFTGAVFGVIVSNTGTVLTIDKWYDPATPGGAAASTPGTGVYVIGSGFQPAAWMGLTENTDAPGATDVALTGELSGSGLQRKLATYSHTAGVQSYALAATYTSSDGTPRNIEKIGVFNSSRDVAGQRMVFTTLVPNPPTLESGDNVTVTDTVDIS